MGSCASGIQSHHFVTLKCGTAVEANKTPRVCKEVIKYTFFCFMRLWRDTKFIFIHWSSGQFKWKCWKGVIEVRKANLRNKYEGNKLTNKTYVSSSFRTYMFDLQRVIRSIFFFKEKRIYKMHQSWCWFRVKRTKFVYLIMVTRKWKGVNTLFL